MSLADILKALQAIGPVLAAVPQVQEVFRVAARLLQGDEEVEVNAILDDLARDNDLGHLRLQAKLAQAASGGAPR